MKRRLLISVFTSILVGLILIPALYFIEPGTAEIGLAASVLFGVLLYGFLWVYDWVLYGRYRAVEEKLPSPFWMRANANFKMPKGKRNGNIYFCEDCVVIVCLEEKPYTMDVIPVSHIARYSWNDQLQMQIITDHETVFEFQSADTLKIIAALKEKKWIS